MIDMDPDIYIEIFHKLAAIAGEYEAKAGGFPHVKAPAYFALLMYVKNASPELQKKAELEFVKMVEALGEKKEPGQPMRASSALIIYCMRELKFELVREAAIKMKNAPEKAGGEHLLFRLSMARLMETYEPVWQGPARDHGYFIKKYPKPEEACAKYWWQQSCVHDREITRKTTVKSATSRWWKRRT